MYMDVSPGEFVYRYVCRTRTLFWFGPPPSPVKPPLLFRGLAGGEVVKRKVFLAKLFRPFRGPSIGPLRLGHSLASMPECTYVFSRCERAPRALRYVCNVIRF